MVSRPGGFDPTQGSRYAVQTMGSTSSWLYRIDFQSRAKLGSRGAGFTVMRYSHGSKTSAGSPCSTRAVLFWTIATDTGQMPHTTPRCAEARAGGRSVIA